jgi:uncharacterized protein YkwD
MLIIENPSAVPRHHVHTIALTVLVATLGAGCTSRPPTEPSPVETPGGPPPSTQPETQPPAPGAPAITRHPKDETIPSGTTARLGVEATGQSLRYQWFRGQAGSTTSPIDGAVEDKLTTPTLTETATFWVRVSNNAGVADSTASTVTVTAAPPSPPPSPAPSPAPSPTPPPQPSEPDPSVVAFEDELFARINQVRAAGATCGATPMPPVAPMAMNAALRHAARAHSEDMASANYFSHTSLDGRSFVDRILAAGYGGGGPYGENIAAGYSSPAAAVSSWMGSSGHCQSIMSGSFRAIGVGYAYRGGSTYGYYWTLTFGGG